MRRGLLGAALGFLALPAFGQSIQAQNASGTEGSNITVPIVFNDNGAGDNSCITNFQFTIDVSDITGSGGGVNVAQCLSTVPEPHASDSFTSCNLAGSNVNVAVFDVGNTEINSGVGSISLSGLTAAGSPYDVNIGSVVFTNCNLAEINPGTGINGTVTVNAASPEYFSAPLNGGLIQMGPVEQGDTDTGALNVQNTGTGTLVISNVQITSDPAGIFSVDPADTNFNVNPGANRNVDFTCAPSGSTTPGAHQGDFTVTTNDADEGSVDYTLSCQVTQAAEPVDVTLSEPAGDSDCQLGGCNFGEVEVGMASAVKAYTLTNNGSSVVANFNIATSNANFSQTNTCGNSIGVGATCGINVTFTPQTSGPKSATLSVSGGGISPAETSNLTGVGTGAPGGDDDDDDDDDDGGLLVLGNYTSGSYFGGASQDGHGFLIEVLGGAEAKGSGVFVVYWFAFLNGAQIWLVGAVEFPPGATSVTVPMQIASGGQFPNVPFDPQAVVKEDWGTTSFEFQDDCLSGLAGWEAEGDFAEDYGSGELPIVRITQIVDCPTVQ